MSCNGCRVLRKGCSDTCVLRTSLLWIEAPESQGNATLFLAKFFGRSDLLNFISAVPENQRTALFQSLLYEACGRTINPVSGAVGLLSSGNWHVCHAAVQTVLSGGVVRPLMTSASMKDELSSSTTSKVSRGGSSSSRVCGVKSLRYASLPSMFEDDSEPLDVGLSLKFNDVAGCGRKRARGRETVSFCSEDSVLTTDGDVKLLNLFV